jgi:hypothetical protein
MALFLLPMGSGFTISKASPTLGGIPRLAKRIPSKLLKAHAQHGGGVTWINTKWPGTMSLSMSFFGDRRVSLKRRLAKRTDGD